MAASGTIQATKVRARALQRTGDQLHTPLVRHLSAAYVMEQNVQAFLTTMISTSETPAVLSELRRQRDLSQVQQRRIRKRLAAHGASPSRRRQLVAASVALGKGAINHVRGDKAARNVRDIYVVASMQVATYELLTRLARRTGDMESARMAAMCASEERAFAAAVAPWWDQAIEQLLAELEPRE